jgi:hypothetical protein
MEIRKHVCGGICGDLRGARGTKIFGSSDQIQFQVSSMPDFTVKSKLFSNAPLFVNLAISNVVHNI